MNKPKTCPSCGGKLLTQTLEGFCPSCTARLTFGLGNEGRAVGQEGKAAGPGRGSEIIQFGEYQLLEELGRGGMGVVYKARQRSLNRIVALKLILSGRFASKQSVERLRAEASAAATLKHPGIVAIHEIGQVDGQHYFSMEYVAGRSLAEMARERPLAPRQAAGYVKAIAEAVQCAHEGGVLHRDLKPSNVLIDEHNQPRITDFGLAKRLDDTSNLTISGKAFGSPSYMPPEQAAGQRHAVGPHSDVYSLGALLYHLLTGRAPFAADTMEATLSEVLRLEPLPPRACNASLPRDLETICLKCLEKDPSRRYSSARQLAEDLRRFENDQPILARPATAADKFWRWTRRNPRVAALSASLLVVFMAGLAGVLWQWQRAQGHAHTERQHRQRLEEALAHKELASAEDSLAAGDVSSSLAGLARVLRQTSPTRHPPGTFQPSSPYQVAATRLLSALTSRNFALPVTGLLPHQASVSSALFSPDGNQVVTASEDGTARVWNAKTGRRLLELLHTAAVRYAEFSPDGRRIATSSEDGTARVWDAETGQALTPPLQHTSTVRRVRFNAKGTRVVTASGDATARVWDSRTGQPVTPPLRHGKYVNDAVFSPDGWQVVTASDDDTACFWDAVLGSRILAPLQHGGDVWSVRFSSDGTKIVTACGDGTARVWHAASGQPAAPPLTHKEMVNFATFSPDGSQIVTASWDNTARVWNALNGAPATPPLEFDSDVLYAEFSSDGRRVFTIADAAARVWDAQTGEPLTEPIVHEAPLRHVGGFSPDGGRVVTPSLDTKAIVWEVRYGAALPEILAGLHAPRLVACSRDGRWLAAARGREFTAHLWDVSTGQVMAGPLPHHGLIVTTEFSPDGERLLTACRDGLARLWCVRSGELVLPPLSHHPRASIQKGDPPEPLNSATFSQDGRRIVTASWDTTARVWDAASGQELFTLQHQAYVQWAEFSPDSRRIVTASGDRTAQVWDAFTGRAVGLPLRHELGLQSARFSPDGRLIATASEDGTARLWNAATGQSVGQPLTHRGHVRSAQFSPDSKLLVTTSLDKTARIWDAVTGEPLSEPIKHPNSVYDAHFSPEGRRFLTVDLGPAIRIRDTATGCPLLEPLGHKAKVEGALFLPDGQRVATVCGDRRLRLWETPVLPWPAPDWLPDLAEAVAAKRLDERGRSIAVPASRLVHLRRQLESIDSTPRGEVLPSTSNFYAQWAQWFFADRSTRKISPFSRVTLEENSRRLGSD